jgi:hypothetical protein
MGCDEVRVSFQVATSLAAIPLIHVTAMSAWEILASILEIGH